MKTALIEFPGHGDGKLFNAEARDSVLEPFIHLRDRFREVGYDLKTADDHPVEDAALILLWDFYEEIPSGGIRKAARSLRRQLRGQRANAGQLVAVGERPAGNAILDLLDNLPVDRLAAMMVESQSHGILPRFALVNHLYYNNYNSAGTVKGNLREIFEGLGKKFQRKRKLRSPRRRSRRRSASEAGSH